MVTVQCAVRRTVGGHPGRPVDRAYPGVAVGGGGRGVERGVLDVVAHRDHVVGAHRLDVHQRAAVVEPELAVVVVDHWIAEVHELGRRPDVELQPLEDGLDRVPLEPECPLHPPGVERARAHPLVDGDVAHPSRPNAPIRWGIPARSMTCPARRYSGTRRASSSASDPVSPRSQTIVPLSPGYRRPDCRVSHIHRGGDAYGVLVTRLTREFAGSSGPCPDDWCAGSAHRERPGSRSIPSEKRRER